MQWDDHEVPSLEVLDAKIKDAQKRVEQKNAPASSPAGHAMKMALDLVSGATVGTALGYALDVWLGTLPLFLLICFGIGIAAGVRLMIESARKLNDENTK